MEFSSNFIEPKWLLKTLPIFIFGFVFFLIKVIYSPEPKLNNLIPLFLFIFIIISKLLQLKKFKLTFYDNFLNIKQLTLRREYQSINISYDKITHIFTRESPINQFLGIKTVIIQLDLPAERNKFQYNILGKSIISTPDLEMLGTWGDLLTFPGLSSKSTESLVTEVLSHTNKNSSDVIHLGIGYPHNSSLVKNAYYFQVVLISILGLLVLIPVILYLFSFL